jgi:Trypsin-like peptidase domain
MPMKMRGIFLLAVCLILVPVLATGQVTSNVFERVLNVRVNAGTPSEATATAFTVDVDGREYLLTAKHVVAGLKDRDKIDIFANGRWLPIEVTIFRCDDPVDVAVLVPPYQLTINFDFPTEKGTFYIGQDCYFLGFPYGIQVPARGANGPYPLAVVKRGTVSGIIPSNGRKTGLVLLDGYNNPGFSGGPIVCRDENQQNTVVLRLIGVVSGFQPEVVPAMVEHNIATPDDAGPIAKSQPWRIRRRSNGTYFEYVDNGTYVALNTGIVIGYGPEEAIELIRHHPIGPLVKDLPGNNPWPGH